MASRIKKFSVSSYLIAAIFSLFLSCVVSVPAWPIFIRVFISFPSLETAVVYEGTLHIEGVSHRSKYGEVAPNFFIIDKQGFRHKVFWGLPGDEIDRFLGHENRFEGSLIRVWYHPIFGVIQEKFVTDFPDHGLTSWGNPYKDKKDAFENHFRYEKYRWRLLPSIASLFLAIFWFAKYHAANKLTGEKKHTI